MVGKENRSDTQGAVAKYPFAVDDSSIKEVTIPATVQGYPVLEIGNRAFMACNYLETVKINAKIIQISPLAFYNCISLKSINIPNTCTFIGFGAISCITSGESTASGSLAVKFEPNATVSYLGEYAIERKAAIVIFYCGTNPPSLVSNALFYGASSKILFAPSEMKWADVNAIVEESVCLLIQENSEKQKVITCDHSQNLFISYVFLYPFFFVNE